MEHAPTIENKTHHQRALDLLLQQGLLRGSDLYAMGVPRVVLSRLTASGQLERVGRGLYRLSGSTSSEYESLATIAVKVPLLSHRTDH